MIYESRKHLFRMKLQKYENHTRLIKFTDLSSLIGNFDCGYSTLWKFNNFLPLWFYMKSILAELRGSKTIILTILVALNFDILGISCLKKSKISKSSKCRAAQIVTMQWQFLGLQNDQTWFHVKSEWQKNLVISTLCIPN